jgi:hypothetical protein
MIPYRAEAVIAASFIVAYVGVAHGLGEQYPFSPLHMFSSGKEVMGQIVARGPDGLHPVGDYAQFHCDGPMDFTASIACGDMGHQSEEDRLSSDYVNAHLGPVRGGDPVGVVRRIFRIEQPGGPLVTTECELAHCTAVLR